MENDKWYEVCSEAALEMDEVIGFEKEGKKYAVFHIAKGYFSTDGLCTHEQASLIDGYVNDDIVECPKHNARFNIITGKAMKRPACIDIRTYPTKVEDQKIWIEI